METKKWYEIILLKISSGRWLLTVAVSFAFMLLVYSYVKYGEERSISTDAISAIVSTVFTSYFLKKRTDDVDKETTTTTTTKK